MTLPAFVDREITANVGDGYELVGAEGRHGSKSMRLSAGEQFQVVNGAGGRWVCEVTEVLPDGLSSLVVDFAQEQAPAPQLILVQALSKGNRDEMAVEICTEIGVDCIIPWQADRSIVRWSGDKARRGIEKWENQALRAAKQSRRAYIPLVEPLVNSKQLADLIGDTETTTIIAHEQATTPIMKALKSVKGSRIMFVIGPEGGITQAEIDQFTAKGAVTASLGANILRASTAGAVCVNLASHLLH